MSGPTLDTLAARAADAVRHAVGGDVPVPACGIVLGSGLGGLARRIEAARRVPFADIPGFPTPTVAGHAGELLVGTLAGRPVLALAGRLHVYEGHEPAVAGFPVRVLHALGARVYLASNAAGGVRRTLRPGDLMVVRDHVNLMFRNPLTGPVQPGDERFPDLSAAYDPALQRLLHQVASALGIALHDGVYAAVTGPSYETPAEIRFLERIGVDAVGMSTVPEVLVARALGMRVAAISCITNHAAGIGREPLSHEEVMDVGRRAGETFERLVAGVVFRLGTEDGET